MFLLYINLLSFSPAPNIFKVVFVIRGRSFGKVCSGLLGKRIPYTVLNIAAGNFSNNVHSQSMKTRRFDFLKNCIYYLFIYLFIYT